MVEWDSIVIFRVETVMALRADGMGIGIAATLRSPVIISSIMIT